MVRATTTEFRNREAVNFRDEELDDRKNATDSSLNHYDASDTSALREKTDFLNDARCPDRLEMMGLSSIEREAVHERMRENLNDRTAPNDLEARLGFAQAAADRLMAEDSDPNWKEAYIYGVHHGEDPKILDFY